MRTLLVTGPGGAGTTTVATATALAAVRDGHRTLLITPDPVPRADLAPDGPAVHTVDSRRVFTERAADVQARFGTLFDLLGASPLDEEEFTELPGAAAFALLQALGAARGHDVVVAALPPLPQAVALLALPGQLRRYLARLLPAERQAARALRPILAQLAGVPMPAEQLYETAARWDAELAAVQAVVTAASTTVRLVAEPGPRATAAVRTARTALALYGLGLEDVVANRLLPAGAADPFYAALADRQRANLEALRAEAADAGVPLHELPHLGADPAGPRDLARLAPPGPAPRPGGDAPAPDPWTVEDRLAAEGRLVWRLPLPCATRDGLDLVRRGDELVVDAAGFRHIMPLPAALRRCTVEGAALRDGALQVRFAPDRALWPR